MLNSPVVCTVISMYVYKKRQTGTHARVENQPNVSQSTANWEQIIRKLVQTKKKKELRIRIQTNFCHAALSFR